MKTRSEVALADFKDDNQTRHCAICGAVISDNNPDGIGSTCRDVWQRAEVDTIYHFLGLEIWKQKVNFWLPVFIDVFKTTKFRSSFKKSFYASCCKNFTEGINFSKKQLDIIKDMLTGIYGKLGYEKANVLLENEKTIYQEAKINFRKNETTEQKEYRLNCAKKHYAEHHESSDYTEIE